MEQPGIGMKLKIIVNSIDAKFNRRNAAFGLTSSQAHMLAYIVRHQGSAVGFQDLEAFFNLRHPTVTGIVQRLEEKGFVICTQDNADRRKKHILPTEKSLNLLQNMHTGRVQVEHELTAGISAEDLAEFERILDQIFRNALRENALPHCAMDTSTSQEGNL